MNQSWLEKRKHPRIDTSDDNEWKIKVFGVKGKPVEGRIVNLSLGGVAFITDWKKVARAVKRFTPKVEIKLPNGKWVDATSLLVRIQPIQSSNDCLCVFQLTDMTPNNSFRLAKYVKAAQSRPY